jgi:predicted nucleotidyltransferase
MEALRITEEFADDVRRFLPETRVYLFGSYAKGTQRPDSDIDIAVMVERFPEDPKEMFRTGTRLSMLAYEYSERYDIEVQPSYVSLNNNASGFVSTILRTGIEVRVLPGWEYPPKG